MSRNASYVFDTALQLSHTTVCSTHAHTYTKYVTQKRQLFGQFSYDHKLNKNAVEKKDNKTIWTYQ